MGVLHIVCDATPHRSGGGAPHRMWRKQGVLHTLLHINRVLCIQWLERVPHPPYSTPYSTSYVAENPHKTYVWGVLHPLLHMRCEGTLLLLRTSPPYRESPPAPLQGGRGAHRPPFPSVVRGLQAQPCKRDTTTMAECKHPFATLKRTGQNHRYFCEACEQFVTSRDVDRAHAKNERHYYALRATRKKREARWRRPEA